MTHEQLMELSGPTLAPAKVARAAFYDLDGTLVRTNLLHAYAYYALNDRGLGSKIRRVAGLAMRLPLYGALESISRKAFNDEFFKAYAGLSEDRLWMIGEECFEDVLKPALFPGVLDMMQRSKENGVLQVLVTGSLEYVVAPLARYLGVDAYGANRLEIRDDKATGQIVPPLMAGPNKAQWMRAFAKDRGISLEDSFAFADSWSDYPMLVSVGRPCAMNPDKKLRKAALEYNWPIVESPRPD